MLTYFQNFRLCFASFQFHTSGFGYRLSRKYYKCSCGSMTFGHFVNPNLFSWPARESFSILMARPIDKKRVYSVGESPSFKNIFRHEEHGWRRLGDSSRYTTINSNKTGQMACLCYRNLKVGEPFHCPSFPVLTLRVMVI